MNEVVGAGGLRVYLPLAWWSRETEGAESGARVQCWDATAEGPRGLGSAGEWETPGIFFIK